MNKEKEKKSKDLKLKDKDKNFTSGSNEISKVEKEIEELENILGTNVKKVNLKIDAHEIENTNNIQEVEEALQRILDSDWGEETLIDISTPIYMLSLEKDSELFYSINRKTFVPVKNNVEVIPVDNPFDSKTKSCFYVINNEIFDIDEEKVICVGWN